jgi:hypothetical protein
VLGNGCTPARSSSRFADRRLVQPWSRIAGDARKPWGSSGLRLSGSARDSGQVGGRVDDPVVAPQNTSGEGDIPLTSEPEAEGAADAVRRAVRCRRERVHEPPAAVIAGQFQERSSPKPLGGVVGPVQFDPAHEQLRPGTREDRDDALVRQGGPLDRGQVPEQLVSSRGEVHGGRASGPAQEDIGGIERHAPVCGLGLEDLGGESSQRGSRSLGGIQDQLLIHPGRLTPGADIPATHALCSVNCAPLRYNVPNRGEADMGMMISFSGRGGAHGGVQGWRMG